MSTRIEDADGNLLWSPDGFGRYSLEKTQTIADILSDMLSDISITVKADSESLQNTYTKEEILELLKLYMLKTDFNEMADKAVQDRTDLYIKSLQDEGKIVTTDTTDSMNRETSDIKTVVNYLTKLCFDSTLASVLGWDTEPTIQPLPPRLDNIDTQIIDISGRVDRVIADVYVDPQTRTGFKFATTEQLDDASDKIGQVEMDNQSTLQKVQEVEQDLSDLSDDVSGLSQSIGDISGIDSTVANASLVGAINNLATLVTGLESRIQSLEDKVAQLEANP